MALDYHASIRLVWILHEWFNIKGILWGLEINREEKIGLAKFVNPNEIIMLLDIYEEVTLFLDNARKFITIGY